MSNLVTSEETFKKTMEGFVKMAKDVFCKDKEHAHMIFFFPKDNDAIPALLFDQVAREVSRENKPGEPLSHVDRSRTFNAIAGVAYSMKAIGYVEIAEGWGLTHGIEDAETPEKALEKYQKTIEEYKFIQNMPMKIEVLTVRGRWRNTMAQAMWKIRRQLEAVWLEPMYKSGPESELDFMPYRVDDISRAGQIDHAIDKVISEEKAGVSS
jgi:hypothetical protein